jgi:hypothetical protein
VALTAHVAVVATASGVTTSELTRTSAAVQKQVARDFGPVWGVQATVDAFASLDDVPLGYWPVIVADDIGADAGGFHQDRQGQPYALVKHEAGWQLAVSHETLEMLADPFGNRTVAAPSVKPGQGRVRYLVEVCDPCEATQYGYTVNGVTVSDFYTPHFFDSATNPATRYSFTGAVKAPRTILRGGYMSWTDPASGHLWQQVWFGSRKQFRDLGPASARRRSLREEVDRLTPRPATAPSREARAAERELARASQAWAAELREDVAGL